MSYHLFLDDSREPENVTWASLPQEVIWTRVKNYAEFISAIRVLGIPEFVTYDCDLHDEHYDAYFTLRADYIKSYKGFKNKCGIECLEHLLEECKKKDVKHPKYQVHTRNQYAETYMRNTIEAFNGNEVKVKTNLDVPGFANEDETTINGFFGKNRFLSNFWPSRVKWNGVEYLSVEVAYQAAKCEDKKFSDQFIGISSKDAKALGKKVPIRKDWGAIKVDVMKFLVGQKFHADTALAQRLLNTRDKYIIEANNWNDRFWGVSYRLDSASNTWECHGGQNNLGKIIVEVRNTLKYV